MFDYQPVSVLRAPLGILFGAAVAVGLYPLLGQWSLVPALALGPVSGHIIDSYFDGSDVDWQNAALGGLIGATGGALGVLLISAIWG